MKMKIVAIFAAFGLMLTGCGTKTNPTQRIENGNLISFIYNETGGYITSTIATDDGNVWEVDGYICDPLAKLEITFDTMGTDDITDDQIVKIIATVEK